VATNLAMREMFDKHLAEEFKDVHVLWLIDPSAEYHESAMPVLFSNAILSKFADVPAVHTVLPFGGRPAVSKTKDLEKVCAAFRKLGH